MSTLRECKEWLERWGTICSAVERFGGNVKWASPQKPASRAAVRRVETKIGFALPEVLREIFQGFSAGWEFSWFLNEDIVARYPKRVWPIVCMSGGFQMSIRLLVDMVETAKEGRGRKEYANHHKWEWLLPVIPGGSRWDYTCLDASSERGEVYYTRLGADGPPRFETLFLGRSLLAHITKWSRLGCPGPEYEEFARFMNERHTSLKVSSPDARAWMKWIGIQ